MLKGWLSYGLVITGSCLSAAAFGLIVLPQDFVAGGVTGLSVLLCGAIPLSVSAMVLLLNLILFVLGWFFVGRDSVMTLAKVEPKYVLLGGVIGAGITWTVIKSMEQLGPAKAALLIVISQLIVAYLIELFGMFGVEKEPFEWRKVIGMGIALIGVAIFQWK